MRMTADEIRAVLQVSVQRSNYKVIERNFMIAATPQHSIQ